MEILRAEIPYEITDVILVLIFLGSTTMLAQDTQQSDPCKAKPAPGVATAKYFLTFDQFERELRVDINREDATALAFLVQFPLHVNESGGGMISLIDAAALKSNFQAVFTPSVRKKILSETSSDVDDIDCNEGYISLAEGIITVIPTDRGYALSAVSQDGIKVPDAYYICQTQTHRIVVDTLARGELRYRSWKKTRAITDTPDLVLTKGEYALEGNRCGTPVYTFKTSAAEYRIDGYLGCYPSYPPKDAPPTGATGRLEVSMKGKPAVDSWCY